MTNDTETQEWVSLPEAIRIVVRLLPDGRLAGFMTDEWIKECWGAGKWQRRDPTIEPEPGIRYLRPADEEWLVRFYGIDWEATRDATNLAYKKAIEILKSVLRKGKIRGFGVCCAKPAEGLRPITEIEWGSRRIELKDNLLATPFRKKPEHFPAILDVCVNTIDLQQECTEVIAAACPKAKTKEVKAGKDGPDPSPRKRGRSPVLMNRVLAEMNDDFSKEYDLDGATEEELASKYFASRDTCRKARKKILSEIVAK